MRRHPLSDEEQKRREDILKRVAVVGGGEMAGKVAAMLATCGASDEGDKGITILGAEPSRERGRVGFGGFLPYIMHSTARGIPPLGSVLTKLKKSKPTKPCAECGEMHSRNNSWCSPECCEIYRQKEKEEK